MNNHQKELKNLMKMHDHKFGWCNMCGPHIVCGYCGNNCCNGGSGDKCKDNCDEAYEIQHQIKFPFIFRFKVFIFILIPLMIIIYKNKISRLLFGDWRK